MTHISKRAVLLVVVICAVLAALVVAFVRGAVSQRGVKTYEGYFAPVYSPDGQHVYFVERRTIGTADETWSGDLFFSSSKYDVSVEKDTFSLKRLPLSRAARSKSSFVSHRLRLRGNDMK